MLKETFHEGEQLGVLLGAIKLSGVSRATSSSSFDKMKEATNHVTCVKPTYKLSTNNIFKTVKPKMFANSMLVVESKKGSNFRELGLYLYHLLEHSLESCLFDLYIFSFYSF